MLLSNRVNNIIFRSFKRISRQIIQHNTHLYGYYFVNFGFIDTLILCATDLDGNELTHRLWTLFLGAASVNGQIDDRDLYTHYNSSLDRMGCGRFGCTDNKKKSKIKKGKNETVKNRKNEGSLISTAKKERCVPRQRQSMDIFFYAGARDRVRRWWTGRAGAGDVNVGVVKKTIVSFFSNRSSRSLLILFSTAAASITVENEKKGSSMYIYIYISL